MRPDEAGAHADAVVIGEGEPVWPRVLADARKRKLRPRYRAETPADLAKLPLPRADLYVDKEGPRYAPDDYPVQVSRGCRVTRVLRGCPSRCREALECRVVRRLGGGHFRDGWL